VTIDCVSFVEGVGDAETIVCFLSTEFDKCNNVLCFLLHLRQALELQSLAVCELDLKQLIHM